MRVGARRLNALSPAPAGPPRSHAPARHGQSRWRCRCGLTLSHPVVAGCGGLSPPAHACGAARGRYDHKLDVFSFGMLMWEWFACELVHREIEVIERSCRTALHRVMLRCNNGFPHSCLGGSHAYGERVHRCRHCNVGPPPDPSRVPLGYPSSAVRQLQPCAERIIAWTFRRCAVSSRN